VAKQQGTQLRLNDVDLRPVGSGVVVIVQHWIFNYVIIIFALFCNAQF
jgi:hypothetical protein